MKFNEYSPILYDKCVGGIIELISYDSIINNGKILCNGIIGGIINIKCKNKFINNGQIECNNNGKIYIKCNKYENNNKNIDKSNINIKLINDINKINTKLSKIDKSFKTLITKQKTYDKILLTQEYSTGYKNDRPIISLVNLKNKKHHSFFVAALQSECDFHIDDDCGISYVSNIKLSQSLLSSQSQYFNDKTSYDAIFVIGRKTKQVRSYIINEIKYINTNKYNCYHYALPELSHVVNGSSLIYTNDYGLVSVGNTIPESSLNILNIHNSNKWIENKMDKPRGYCSADMISDDELICVGGGSKNKSDPLAKYVDVYNLKTQKWNKISSTNYPRRHCGIACEKYIYKRVYISGGIFEDFKCEYFDLNKNKWYNLPSTNGKHYKWPVMWIENVNIIHITSLYGQLFESFDIRENKWIIYLNNKNNNEIDKIFGTKFGKGRDYRICVR